MRAIRRSAAPDEVRLNPLLRRVTCSRTGTALATEEDSRPLGRCVCCPPPGSPLLVRYASPPAAATAPTAGALTRFAAHLPVVDLPPGYADDVGSTPTYAAVQAGRKLSVDLWIKSEAGNPSGSFKDRGLAVAIALGVVRGARRFGLPTQGNAGVSAALFSARLGLPPTIIYMPEGHRDGPYARAAERFGAELNFFGANIAAAGRQMREELSDELAAGTLVDISTFFEPGRLEGKKTLGLEISEFFREALPDYIFYPTGGGTGLVGIWKAFEELVAAGRLDRDRKLPKMIAVQSAGCAPVVGAFSRGEAVVRPVDSMGTIAVGLDVPAAIMGHEILRVLRASEGGAVAVTDEAILAASRHLAAMGNPVCLEGAATYAALAEMRSRDELPRGATVLLLNTAGMQGQSGGHSRPRQSQPPVVDTRAGP